MHAAAALHAEEPGEADEEEDDRTHSHGHAVVPIGTISSSARLRSSKLIQRKLNDGKSFLCSHWAASGSTN